MTNFRPIDRQTSFLLPPSVDDWLPQQLLARFVVEVIDGLDTSAMSGAYRGSGSASYHPQVLLGILIYGYATGVFSSRMLERATHNSVARTIIPITTPSQRSGAGFGRRFRAVLQRSSRRGGRQSAGGRQRCGAGAQRQAAARTDAGQDPRPA